MNFRNQIFSVVLFMALTVIADSTWIGDSCTSAMGNYKVECGKLGYYPCHCSSDIFIASTMNCIHSMAKGPQKVKDTLTKFIDSCEKYGLMKVSYESFESVYQNALTNNSFMSTHDIKNISVPLTQPVIFTSKEIQIAVDTVKTYNYEHYTRTLFG